VPDYLLFGRRVRSDLDFPELEPTPHEGPPDLLLSRLSGTAARIADQHELLGETETGNGATVRLFRDTRGRGFLIHYSDTGTFAISASEIRWWPGATADDEAARVDLKGRVIPLALHLSGHLCLHAGAVVVEGSAIAFLGPKRAGKSTLTAAMVRAGAGFLSDDVLPLLPPSSPGQPVRALPGAGAFRLWNDSAGTVDFRTEYEAPGLGGKLNVRIPVASAGPRESFPLGAVYLLTPADPDDEPDPRRIRIPETPALMGLVNNTKNVELLGGGEHPLILDRTSLILASTPCFQLLVPRRLDQLPAVAAKLLDWHHKSRRT